jgi:hypothetical protein
MTVALFVLGRAAGAAGYIGCMVAAVVAYVLAGVYAVDVMITAAGIVCGWNLTPAPWADLQLGAIVACATMGIAAVCYAGAGWFYNLYHLCTKLLAMEFAAQ